MLLPPPLNQETRESRLDAAGSVVYDLLVLGGGITGTGIARDAAMRGLKVALLDQGDLAVGTSSRSSKLVHGGLRYLEHYQFKLVFESVSERALLRRLAPHLVRPIPFLFPSWEGDKVPLWMMQAGVTLYDLMTLGRGYRWHRRHGPEAVARLEPGLLDRGLKGALLYYDCATDDARLTLATGLSAHDNGAHIFTHVRADQLRIIGREVEGVDATDLRTGRPRTFRAPVVVCALGPWTDQFLGRTRPGSAPMLRTTKGVHFVVRKDRLPVQHAVVIPGPGDGRILFAIPFDTHTYVGTTDTDFDGDMDAVFADRTDIDYLLEAVNGAFPGARLEDDDIVGTWAGLRPLIDEDDKASASAVSREHTLEVSDDGLVVIAGGKLTTYRRMAAEVVNAAVGLLRRRGTPAEPCSTAAQPLPGGAESGDADAGELLRTLGEPLCDHLRRRYGSDWDAVAGVAASDEGLTAPVVEGLPIRWVDIVHAIREEGALTLDDLLLRRTDLFLKAPDQGLECIDAVADQMATMLTWDEDQRLAEIARYRELVTRSRTFLDG